VASSSIPIPNLPKGLESIHIARSIDFIEGRADELVELYFEQANVFSGVVGILGVRALDSLSPYKRHKHPDVAQQRFPDLSFGGKLDPPPELALESKGSIRAWAVQSHYDHPGWYVVWRYLVDPTKSIKSGRSVVIWRVDMLFVHKEDWKYEGSKAGQQGGGRTHTFAIRSPAVKLRNACAFALASIVLRNGRPVLAASSQ
jgi:hypothetical protein